MKEYRSGVIYFVGILFLFALLLVPCVQSKAAEFELKFGALNPEGLYMAKIAKAWMAKVEKETNGRVHFTAYWGGTLITPPDAPDEVARGVVDVGLFSADYPKVGFDFVKSSGTFWYGISTAGQARLLPELEKKYPQIEGEFAKYGKVLGIQSMSQMKLMTNKKPIRKLADLKGFKIKATPAYVPFLQEVGAEAVMMSMFDCYLALQKGMIDGVLAPLDTLVPLKFIEVIKYITDLDLTYAPQPGPMISLKTWAKLPPDIQKVFENNVKFFNDECVKVTNEVNEEMMAAAKKAGIEFIKLPAQDDKKVDEILFKESQKKAAELDAKKYPGTAILQDLRKAAAAGGR
jgi:TRAP-type C4-dicarboxylate transport system substrate-binding protein